MKLTYVLGRIAATFLVLGLAYLAIIGAMKLGGL